MKRTSDIEITEEGYYFHKIGLVDRKKAREKSDIDDDGTTPDIRKINMIGVSSNSSSSAEEVPQDYKPAEYLLLHKK